MPTDSRRSRFSLLSSEEISQTYAYFLNLELEQLLRMWTNIYVLLNLDTNQEIMIKTTINNLIIKHKQDYFRNYFLKYDEKFLNCIIYIFTVIRFLKFFSPFCYLVILLFVGCALHGSRFPVGTNPIGRSPCNL